MSKPTVAILFIVVILVGGIIYISLNPKVEPIGPCGAPPNIIVGSNINVDAALAGTLAVLKGTQEMKALDVIPPKARVPQVTNYLVCLAREKGMVKTPEEVRDYADLMGFLSTNPSAEEYLKFMKERFRQQRGLPIQVEGFFNSLRVHFEKNVTTTEFELILDNSKIKDLDRLWIGDIRGETWAEVFSKICRANASCLKCTPPPGKIDKAVKIEISGPLAEGKTDEGVKKYSCAN